MTTHAPEGPQADTELSWRRQHVGHLLAAATDRCVRDKLDIVRANGFGEISEAQLTLFHHLDLAGDRLTTIAARARLTKQSMIELVNKAEALALVERRPDPADRRAKIMLFTERGRLLLETLHHAVVAAEQHVAQAVGRAFLTDMKRVLRGYARLPAAANAPADDFPWASVNAAWRTDNIGRVLSYASRRFVADMLGDLRARGGPDLPEVLLPLFRHIAPGGTRLTEIASGARMTKQSMRELVDRAAALGFVERRPDPADRRAKAIMFTADGIATLDGMQRSAAAAQAQLGRVTGDAFLDELKLRLRDYVEARAGEERRAA